MLRVAFIDLLQAVGGAGTALCAFLIGRLLFSPAAGTVAGALATVYPYYVVHDTAQETGLFTFATALSAFLLLQARDSDSRLPLAAAGLALGAAVLTRSIPGPLLPDGA
jgi:4-amino-4-deoxy-L-arabinose transferase-like glycosyltransferase